MFESRLEEAEELEVLEEAEEFEVLEEAEELEEEVLELVFELVVLESKAQDPTRRWRWRRQRPTRQSPFADGRDP